MRIQLQKSKNADEEHKPRNIIDSDERPRSTLADLVSQIHQMQQIVREKEMLMKRNEISSNFKVFIQYICLILSLNERGAFRRF